MPTTSYLLAAIGLAAAITFTLRLIPFVIKNALKDNELVKNLAGWLPMGALIILGLFVLAEIDYSSRETAFPYLIAAVVTVVVHVWRKNIVVSLLLGTVTCVILANWVF